MHLRAQLMRAVGCCKKRCSGAMLATVAARVHHFEPYVVPRHIVATSAVNSARDVALQRRGRFSRKGQPGNDLDQYKKLSAVVRDWTCCDACVRKDVEQGGGNFKSIDKRSAIHRHERAAAPSRRAPRRTPEGSHGAAAASAACHDRPARRRRQFPTLPAIPMLPRRPPARSPTWAAPASFPKHGATSAATRPGVAHCGAVIS